MKKNDDWYLCNDTKIYKINYFEYSEFISHNAYLVFYHFGPNSLTSEIFNSETSTISAFPQIEEIVQTGTKATLEFE